jgi:LemA protein
VNVSTGTKVLIALSIVLALFGIFYVSTYNEKVTVSTRCDKQLSNLDEAYRRRADITENLVETIKSEVGAESSLITDYAQARAAAGGQMKLTPEMMKDPVALKAFQANQGSLGNVLGRLMIVAEKIPSPQFSAAYRDLRASLDGTNNRIGIAIKDYNKAVEENNNLHDSFFSGMVASAKFPKREFYKVEEEKKAVPKLKDMNMDMRTKK